MFGLKHTLQSVARKIAGGLEGGLIALDSPREPELLYSAESSRLMNDLGSRFRTKLRRNAANLAEVEGRNLVTEDDVWNALDDLVGPMLDSEPIAS